MVPLVLAVALFAQILTPGQAYTTNGENNDAQFGLNTVDGVYMVSKSDTGDCSAITHSMNVMVTQQPSDDGTQLLTVVNPIYPDGTVGTQDCHLIVYRLMGDRPCAQTNGVCDVANDPQSP